MHNHNDYTQLFSETYDSARKRFRKAAHIIGASLDELALRAQGPDGTKLTIDMAWLGSMTPKQVLLHFSGIHGVEAFVGSPIQLQLLASPPKIPQNGAVVFIHVLNPYGMAWFRRTNESNVDLNRNFLPEETNWTGTPELYKKCNSFLNPKTAHSFYLPILLKMMKYGSKSIKQAITRGQYDDSQGLFFGGKELEEGTKLLIEWIKQKFRNSEHVVGIDVHSGLGRRYQEILMLPLKNEGRKLALSGALKRPIEIISEDTSIGPPTKGGLCLVAHDLLPKTKVDFFVEEFGTYPALPTLKALRDENRTHMHEDSSNPSSPAKQKLKEIFCPASEKWRIWVVKQGLDLAYRAAKYVFQENIRN